MRGLPILVSIILFSISLVTSKSYPNSVVDNFLQCLPKHYRNPSKPIAKAIYTPTHPSFQSVYELHTYNLRVLTQANATHKPMAIVAALHESHVQAAVICAKESGLLVRIRSGGHDYEGLSFSSSVPFVIIDLSNLRSIKIDMKTETAWVQAGATTGELYYRIAEKSNVHAFPAGVCTTLGIGGHFTGGGYGNMLRKFGLSIDNVVDAQLINAKGRILNRKSMGEDVFWAIRGGGGTSFGIILSWKIKLVRVPPKVTVFQAGATTGELYYRIAEKSKVHAFPAGVCTTLGIGGHFTGGGYGNMLRKFGLSIDNVVDAQLINAKGRILNRKSMGEDVFWAIRGGGGTSFGIILSWKIKLVRVPPKVTVFQVAKTLEQGATVLVHKWLQVSHKLDKDIFIRIMPVTVAGTGNGNSTVRVSFIGHYLGRTNRLLPSVNASFPELGLQRKDCTEMSWIESTLYWAGFPNGTSTDVLLNRVPNKVFFKTKSDYLKNVMPKAGLETLWKVMMEIGNMWMQMSPYGGRMAEISESETAFAHRAGTLYLVQYTAHWSEGSSEATKKYVELMRKLYAEMAPYVSTKPREAFLNYRDLDIGSNNTDFEAAKVYGAKYFKGNFQRLAEVKAKIDPHNFFKNEQSIPPFPSF
ncbi:hypothetical protein GOBAR_AA31799 [Gossypium barbadense]|uniref:FAD-binding PCMH-type domain-containing protein n=1 Tax=Gossypium barbadense TaxID=3634 RepID=A0A2P5WCR7_GOSBA|nr:hypothetical protein GOBAR_AA31799 [Gossypium barbadense]